MMPSGADIPSGVTVGENGRDRLPRLAWRAAVFATILTGILHLFNLVEWSRLPVGPALLTPFRATFALAWALLAAMLVSERRLPRVGPADAVILAFFSFFLVRALFVPETLGTSLNWIMTAAGVYFLVRLGTRDQRDIRCVVWAISAAVLASAVFGLIEYAAKANPLFDAITVEAVGIDRRILASDEFYRIRGLVGHPGFAAAIVLGGVPLLIMVFRRRPLLLAAALIASLASLFLTFSRGSWLLAAVFLLPLLWSRSRHWFRRNLKWAAPLALVVVLLVAFDYWNREEAFVDFDGTLVQQGMSWSKGGDGPVVPVDGGISPFGSFVYFEVDDGFAFGDAGPVTVVVHYRDRGKGALRVDFFSRDRDKADGRTGMTPTPSINKTDTGEESVAAFYLEDPLLDGHLNKGADFRVVDDDNHIIIERVELQKGKTKLPAVIVHQWLSRSASLSTRAELFPFAWEVFREHPWGVGMFNSPGTGNHAVDSLPLTWLMEFGWIGIVLFVLLVALVARELLGAWRGRRDGRGAASVLLLAMTLLFLHGGHLMILYDKPSIVMLSSLAAVYVAARPRRSNGPDVELTYDDLAL